MTRSSCSGGVAVLAVVVGLVRWTRRHGDTGVVGTGTEAHKNMPPGRR